MFYDVPQWSRGSSSCTDGRLLHVLKGQTGPPATLRTASSPKQFSLVYFALVSACRPNNRPLGSSSTCISTLEEQNSIGKCTGGKAMEGKFRDRSKNLPPRLRTIMAAAVLPKCLHAPPRPSLPVLYWTPSLAQGGFVYRVWYHQNVPRLTACTLG